MPKAREIPADLQTHQMYPLAAWTRWASACADREGFFPSHEQGWCRALQTNTCMAHRACHFGGARRCRVACTVKLTHRVNVKSHRTAILQRLQRYAQVCPLSAGLFQQKGFEVRFHIIVDSFLPHKYILSTQSRCLAYPLHQYQSQCNTLTRTSSGAVHLASFGADLFLKLSRSAISVINHRYSTSRSTRSL